METTELYQALRKFKDRDEDITVMHVMVFLLIIARNCKLEIRDISQELDISQSGISRAVAKFTALDALKKPGLGLISFDADPMDMRRKRFTLTAKGKAFLAELEET